MRAAEFSEQRSVNWFLVLFIPWHCVAVALKKSQPLSLYPEIPLVSQAGYCTAKITQYLPVGISIVAILIGLVLFSISVLRGIKISQILNGSCTN